MYDLVPYLKEDGNRHDFSHTIHELAFEGDDEYDISKAEIGREMKQRMGISDNPLDGSSLRVRRYWIHFAVHCFLTLDRRRASSNTCSNTS